MRLKTWLAITGLTSVLLGLFFLWPIETLTLRQVTSNEALYRMPVRAGTMVRLRFLHSYEKGWVEEVYRVRSQGDFQLVEHAFQVFNYDAREATYRGDFSMDDDGFARVRNIARYQEVVFPSLYIRVANMVPQMLELEEKKQVVSLPGLAPGGTLLQMRLEKANRMMTMGVFRIVKQH
ncbi:hypothetical protein SY88_15675 [Clostridiales bacterium PH28_bin88]|nr:hypothetical protein SY88_15675 [Clostridiales bacterium PH28_bin88]